MKITTNFSLEEFTDREISLISPVQMMMLQYLCNNLEVIRAFLNCSIKINNGIRLPSDNNNLRNQGFNPSETSDHLYGNIIKLRTRAKIKQFGKYYVYSVGAADIDPACGSEEAFDRMKPYFNRAIGVITLPAGQIQQGHLTIGQMILESREGNSWIHISNPPELIYSPTFVSTFLNRPHFLKSINNGGSYESI